MKAWNGSIAGVLVSLSIVSTQPVASQQQYPSRAVHIIVPYAAGGVTDVVARVIAEELSKSLGQPVVVENRTGAGGSIGLEAVFRAPHDGYTIVMMPANLTIMSALYPKLTFDPIRDFTPIVLIGTSPSGISAHASLPIKSLKEMVTYAKTNPAKLSYASCGIASPQHLTAEYLKNLAAIDIIHIPYKGCNDANPDVFSGRVPLYFATMPHLLLGQQGGKINPLAVTSKSRTEWTPQVPTVVEAGYPDLAFEAWFGFLAARDTPQEIVVRINAEVNKAMTKPTIQQRMKKLYFVPVGGSRESFSTVINSDAKKLGAVIKQAGIKVD
ncbi:MAG: tripartite tricarboxylate transporter substrate binding protein [Hyphomicrobiales bacterium]|nr:tripartite tricarboxylate transporter substrate binding protein [Hyphomicrobiales bacterium]